MKGVIVTGIVNPRVPKPIESIFANKIAKCPACYSGNVLIHTVNGVVPGFLHRSHFLECGACSCRGPRSDALTAAVYAWNFTTKACLHAEDIGLI